MAFFYDYLYEIKEKEINYLEIRDEDKTKLKRYIVFLDPIPSIN